MTKYTLNGKYIVHMTRGNDELHFFKEAEYEKNYLLLRFYCCNSIPGIVCTFEARKTIGRY